MMVASITYLNYWILPLLSSTGIITFIYILKQYLVHSRFLIRASLVAQVVKNLPAMQETLVEFLGWEDYLEKG